MQATAVTPAPVGRHAGEQGVLVLIIVLISVLAGLLTGPAGLGRLWTLALNGMVPIALAAVGEVLNERGGLFNIGIEGIMLLGSFAAVLAAEQSSSWAIGLVAGLMTGGLVAAVFGLMATYGRANQVVAGVAINILALGLVAYGLVAVWGNPGFRQVAGPELRVPSIATPFGPLSWMVFVAIAAGLVLALVLDHTRFGLHVRAAGYNPFVTDISGVDVLRLRTVACTIGGALAGLGGAYMALDWLGLTARDLIQGRGFIALACVVFSGLEPVLAVGAALLFALFNALGLWLQNLPWAAPLMLRGGSALFLMLPYLAVLTVLWAFPRRVRLSKEIGLPYQRA